MMNADDENTTLDKVHKIRAGLVAEATGGKFDGGDDEYQRLRREILALPDTKSLVPNFVRRNRSLAEFWQYIKYEYSSYAERRAYIWKEFTPLLDRLEADEQSPGVGYIAETLAKFDPDHVHVVWQKALDRRTNDPEGAITAARTLLESVCKFILDECGVAYSENADLPKLYGLCASCLNLAPHQHQEEIFKAILGNCQSVVQGIAAIRNKVGDAHGQGRRPVKPKARHAELAVNLAGTMASFLVSTWREKQQDGG